MSQMEQGMISRLHDLILPFLPPLLSVEVFTDPRVGAWVSKCFLVPSRMTTGSLLEVNTIIKYVDLNSGLEPG
jgi:hypothetical protein